VRSDEQEPGDSSPVLSHRSGKGTGARLAAPLLKETLARQVQQAMEKGKISKVEMARRMNTSRAALDRLLDPGNASVTLQTLTRAAQAVGRDLRIELV
jgi:antitoxin HicB